MVDEVDKIAGDMYEKAKDIVDRTIDTFSQTWWDNVEGSRQNVKDAIEGNAPEITQGLANAIRPLVEGNATLTAKLGEAETQVTDLTSQLETSKTNAENYVAQVSGLATELSESAKGASELQAALEAMKPLYEAVQQFYAPSLATLVEKIPEDVLKSLASYLHETDPNNISLEAIKAGLGKMEDESTARAENEDRARAYRAQFDNAYLVEIGTVTEYLSDKEVAVIQLMKPLEGPLTPLAEKLQDLRKEPLLKQGDTVYIPGPETDLEQKADSIQIDKAQVTEANAGNLIGLKVQSPVAKDSVYKVV